MQNIYRIYDSRSTHYSSNIFWHVIMDEYDVERKFEELEREIRLIKEQNIYLIRELEKRNLLIKELLIKLNQIIRGEKTW